MESGLVRRSITRAVRAPARTARILLSRQGRAGVSWLLLHARPGAGLDPTQPIVSRSYRSYDAYVAHQRSKLPLLDLTEYDRTFRVGLADRLADGDWAGRSVLCLAARIGTEVKAFHDVGAFAVGIDLNPGKDNPWVLPGDFHHLVFPDRSVDAVYCNALDHALDLGRTVREIHRVLRLGGTLLVDAQQGAEELAFDGWAATSWQSVNDLVKAIESFGLTPVGRDPITIPWSGEQLTFVRPE